METAGFIVSVIFFLVPLSLAWQLFFAKSAGNGTMTTWKITRKGGKVMYHTTNENPTNDWDDVISVEEVKL